MKSSARRVRRRAFVHPPCTTESFPTPASPGCRSPWELVPRWEFPPRCHTTEIPRCLRGRTWLIRPTPYETSSFLRAARVCVLGLMGGGGQKGASVFFGLPRVCDLLSDAGPRLVNASGKGNRRLPEEGYCSRALS